MSLQASRAVRNKETSMPAKTTISRGMSHTQGGWPVGVDPKDADHVMRWRKKIERDEDYIKTVVKLGAVVEDIVKLNNTFDIYSQCFEGVEGDQSEGGRRLENQKCSIATVTLLKSVESSAAYGLAWHPDQNRLASAHAPSPERYDPMSTMPSYLWNLSQASTPEMVLKPFCALNSLSFSVRDHNLLAGGQQDGRIALFDLRTGGDAAHATHNEKSHKGAVLEVRWTQSKTSTEVMSCATDGSIKWWDVRKFDAPIEELLLPTALAGSPSPSALCLNYSSQAGPSKFLVGTITGSIIAGNRKAKTPDARIVTSFNGHDGPVCSVARNSFLPKYFVSAGDWTARVWSEDVHSQLLSTPYQNSQVIAAEWSPSRPGVFLVADCSGYVQAWDVLRDYKKPQIRYRATDAPLMSLSVTSNSNSHEQMWAAGCHRGRISIFKPSSVLVQPIADEKTIFAAMMERECGRERNLEKQAKEAKVKARRYAAKIETTFKPMSEEEIKELERKFFDEVGLVNH